MINPVITNNSQPLLITNINQNNKYVNLIPVTIKTGKYIVFFTYL